MAFIFEVRVVPSSGKQLIMLDKAGRLKCYLTSPAEKGLANKELIKLLAKALGLTLAEVAVIAGATGRTKLVRIPLDLTFDTLIARLGLDKQMSLV